MNTTAITVAFIAEAAALIALFGFLLRQQRAHYESLLREVRADNRDLRDRWNVKHNLPPAGVDLKAEHEERREERKRQQADPARRAAPDPTWKMRRTLAENERKRAAANKGAT